MDFSGRLVKIEEEEEPKPSLFARLRGKLKKDN